MRFPEIPRGSQRLLEAPGEQERSDTPIDYVVRELEPMEEVATSPAVFGIAA